jgi:hypothetical protein
MVAPVVGGGAIMRVLAPSMAPVEPVVATGATDVAVRVNAGTPGSYPARATLR